MLHAKVSINMSNGKELGITIIRGLKPNDLVVGIAKQATEMQALW